jgi:hypothetical protein
MNTCGICGTEWDPSFVKECPVCFKWATAAPGGPVEQLDPNDPVNRALAMAVLCFNALYEAAQTFVDDKMHAAHKAGFTGWLDVRGTVDGDKWIVRRRLRAHGEKLPPGRGWWHIPVSPTILDEFFERVKPAPPEEPEKAIDVDAATEEQGAPAPLDVNALLRARAREVDALAGNMWRTKDELLTALGDAAGPVVEVLKEARLALLRISDAIAREVEARGTLQ